MHPWKVLMRYGTHKNTAPQAGTNESKFTAILIIVFTFFKWYLRKHAQTALYIGQTGQQVSHAVHGNAKQQLIDILTCLTAASTAQTCTRLAIRLSEDPKTSLKSSISLEGRTQDHY